LENVLLKPGTNEWLNQVHEEIFQPEQPIIDTHHHLWDKPSPMWGRYILSDLWGDTGSGHNVVKTVFVECHSAYKESGPEHLRPVGETEYVVQVALESANDSTRATISGIVGHADLTSDSHNLQEVLAEHEAAGKGLFRGIRHAGPSDQTGTLTNAGRGYPSPYGRTDFRDGVRLLGRLGYTYDTWHFFHQNRDYLELAQSAPDTMMVLDHFGTPLGVGAYANKQEEIYQKWKQDIAEIAKCPNVVAKLGGLAMPDNGFGWDKNDRPPTSDEFAEAQKKYYLHTVECFGPDRCMVESNFPVDRLSLSYQILWNGIKKILAEFSESERDAMFYKVAERIYRL